MKLTTMSEPIRIELIPDDEPEEGEGIISADEFFAAIMEGAQQSEAWRNGDGTLRITQFVDGQRIGPMEMTRADYDQLQRDLAAQEQPPVADEANGKEAATTGKKSVSVPIRP